VLLLAAAVGTARPGLGDALALTAYAVIGLGTGLSVTATNLAAASGADSREGDRARRLSLVNLWWGIGAVGCPWLVAAAVRAGDLRVLLAAMAAATAAMFLALAPLLRGPGEPVLRVRRPGRSQLPVLMVFSAMLFLYVGVENTVGGWIAAYGHRFGAMTLARASLLVSVFWLALLLGRLLGTAALRAIPERGVLLPSVLLGLVAVAVLIQPCSSAEMVAAAVGAGLGLGPVFPITVSRLLARIADQRHTGWAFATCSGGGAVLPWLTGLVSTRTESLRTGFAVPAAAMALILVLALSENVLLHEPSPVETAHERA
jgi:fucose permease